MVVACGKAGQHSVFTCSTSWTVTASIKGDFKRGHKDLAPAPNAYLNSDHIVYNDKLSHCTAKPPSITAASFA